MNNNDTPYIAKQQSTRQTNLSKSMEEMYESHKDNLDEFMKFSKMLVDDLIAHRRKEHKNDK